MDKWTSNTNGLLISAFTALLGLNFPSCSGNTGTTLKNDSVNDTVVPKVIYLRKFLAEKDSLDKTVKTELDALYEVITEKSIAHQGCNVTKATEVLVNNEYKIKAINYTDDNHINIPRCFKYRDRLIIGSNSIFIDSLYYGKDFTKDSPPVSIGIFSIEKIQLGNETFLFIAMINRNWNTSSSTFIPIVVKYSAAAIQVHYPGTNCLDTPCPIFLDINDDLKLDYINYDACREAGADTVFIYTLENKGLKKNPNLYITLKKNAYLPEIKSIHL
jgi:hypothetical protein